MTQRALSSRAGLLLAIAGGIAGSALVLLAAGRVWAAHTFTGAAGASQHVVVRGHDVAASLPALATAAMALSAVLVATRSWLRRGVGLLLVVAGGAMIGVAVTARSDVAAALTRRAFAAPHVPVGIGGSAWPWVAAVGALVVVAVGALVVVVGSSWPALGRRYDAPTAMPADDDTSVWSALDRGEDPTA